MSSVNISDRIAALLKDKQLSAIELSKVIQVQRSTLSHILSGRNKPSIDLLERFHTAFEDLSLEWLITGKGKMYKAPVNDESEAIKGSVVDPVTEYLHTDEPKAVPELEKPVTPAESSIPIDSTSPPKLQSAARSAIKTMIFYSDGTFELFTNSQM